MTREQLLAEIEPMVYEVANRPLMFRADAQILSELGLDSVEVLEIVAEIEDRYQIQIPLAELERLHKVDDLITFALGRMEAA